VELLPEPQPAENTEFSAASAPVSGARLTSDPMESAYTSVHLWAKAVEEAGTDEVKAVRQGARQQSFDAPGGGSGRSETQHLYKTFRLGQITGGPVRGGPQLGEADPARAVPGSRTRTEWEKFLNDLRRLGRAVGETGLIAWPTPGRRPGLGG
jgi:hypothetical protein